MYITEQEKQHLESLVRIYEDFPEKGISFKELSLIYADSYAMEIIQSYFASALKPLNPDCIIGCDARGFIIGTLMAHTLKLPFVLARKPGKLPGEVITKQYGLEYGKNELQIHKHIISKYKSPVIADDVLASSGTVSAVTDMLLEIGIKVNSYIFISEITSLFGRQKLKDKYNIADSNIFTLLES